MTSFRQLTAGGIEHPRACKHSCGYCGQRKSAMCHTINRLLRSDRVRSSLSWRWRGPGGGTPPRIRRLGRSSNSCGTASKSDAGVLAGGPKTTTRRTAGSSRKVIECDRRFPDVFERADYARSPKVRCSICAMRRAPNARSHQPLSPFVKIGHGITGRSAAPRFCL